MDRVVFFATPPLQLTETILTTWQVVYKGTRNQANKIGWQESFASKQLEIAWHSKRNNKLLRPGGRVRPQGEARNLVVNLSVPPIEGMALESRCSGAAQS